MRALAGFNEPLMVLDWLDLGKTPAYEIRPVSIFRYWKEIVVEEPRVGDLRRTGVVENGRAGL